MGAVEDLTRLDDPPRLALAQIDQRVAAGPVNSGETQDVRFGPSRPGRRRPARLVLEPRKPRTVRVSVALVSSTQPPP